MFFCFFPNSIFRMVSISLRKYTVAYRLLCGSAAVSMGCDERVFLMVWTRTLNSW
ncbi:hypothetical protein D3C76_1027480 [compost metagenome]